MKKMIGLLCIAAMLTGCGSDAGTDGSDKGSDDGFAGILKSSGSLEEQSETEKTPADTTAEEEKSTEEKTTAEKNSETKAPEEKTTAVQPAEETSAETPAEGISYRQMLEDIYYERMLPDGRNLPDDDYGISANEFAVYDIDGDGSDELIIMYHNTAMAGMFASIYGRDESGNIITELFAFPSMRFYDNGVIEVNISHNQGHSGAFWPYSLYQYDPGADKYNEIAFVEAMDKELVDRINVMIAESGSDDLLVYPQEADTSGSGFVYYIRPEGNSGDVSPVDVTEYEKWHEQYVGGAQQLSLPFMKLTEENIQKIN